MKQLSLFLIIVFFCIATAVVAQPNATDSEFNYPEIGKACPDFLLNEIYNYPKNKASLQDFKGKWLILDFWTRGCASCIEGFPKLNELTKEFRGKVQIVLVGNDDKLIRKMYERFRQKYNLDMTTAYDSAIHKRFGIPSYPYIMWVDDKGIIRAITEKSDLTASHIQAFLNGEDLKLSEKLGLTVRQPKKSFDFGKPFLIDGNGGEDADFLYRSVLTEWKKNMPSVSHTRFEGSGKLKNEFLMCQPLKILYHKAYGDTISMNLTDKNLNSYGKYWPVPLLELSDSSEFVYDPVTRKNCYCYDLIVPPAKNNRGGMQRMMQLDLKKYFGYNVTVETRMMPYWKLVAMEGAGEKLRSKGKREFRGDGYTSVTYNNEPVSQTIFMLWAKHQLEPPFIDETGIKFNIDLTIDAFLNDLNDVKRSLQKSGLDLTKGQKEMKVIVIRDK